jgi:dsRNA-specific ribonuclease
VLIGYTRASLTASVGKLFDEMLSSRELTDEQVAFLQQTIIGSKALEKVEKAENLEFAGDYAGSARAAEDLINTIDRLDSGALDATKIESVRDTAADLGRVISNLPLPFTNQNEKLRFSDLPPVMRTLVEDMITRVEAKIGKEDADVATQKLRSYMSGGDVLSQSEISSEMSTLLRLLT